MTYKVHFYITKKTSIG